MSHCLIVGASGSGKSALAKLHARRDASARVPVFVYDPLVADDWPDTAIVSDDMDAVIDSMRACESNRLSLFIDEADTVLSMADRAYWWLLQRGRHYGIHCSIITQRPALVAPTARGQCAELFAFRVSADDGKLLAADFADARLAAELPQLPRLHFVRSAWGGNGEKTLEKFRLTFQKSSGRVAAS